MKIKFTGSELVVRMVDGYVWSSRTGLVQDVPPELAVNLLTLPRKQFEIDESDPFMALDGITDDEVISLVLAGVETVDALRELDKSGITRLVKTTSISRTKLSLWANTHEE